MDVNPIMNSEESLRDLQTEISKAQKRLDHIYNHTKELENTSAGLDLDIGSKEKHIRYLDGVIQSKELEIEGKVHTLSTLDTQISDKGREFDQLQHDINSANAELIQVKDEVSKSHALIKEHSSRIDVESEKIASLHQDTRLKNEEASAKLEKIRTFINSL